MWLLDKALKGRIRNGHLRITDAGGQIFDYGNPAEPPLHIRFTHKRTPWRIARNPALGAGEAYMDGELVVEPPHDIRDMVLLFSRNGSAVEGDWRPAGPARRALRRLPTLWEQFNPRGRASRNVAHHYELSRRFYELFLDADRQYTMAYFRDPADSEGRALERAQQDKLALIAAKLRLRPGMRVLDIGSGWGGLALYLNRMYDVEVLGVSLAPDQVAFANERAAVTGVAGAVQFRLMDYRDVPGTFDRITSVGMIEHVGAPHLAQYFAATRDLLADDGIMLTHTIGRQSPPGRSDAWTRKYIFPGGYIPALSELAHAAEATGWEIGDVEVLRFHYAHTLAEWYRRTTANRAEIVALHDESLFRMWQFYLAGAEQSFRYGRLVNFQLQTVKRRDALPMTRDYMVEEAARLRSAAAAAIRPAAESSPPNDR